MKTVFYYNINLIRLLLFLFDAFLALFYLLIYSNKHLKMTIKRFINGNIFQTYNNIIFFKSGRSALYGLLCELSKANPRYNVIYLPDYICNVVYQAAEKAGYEIISYKTNIDFTPAWDKLSSSIKNDNFPVILLASIFGTVNTEQISFDIINNSNKNAFIIADECQNFILNAPTGNSKNVAVLFSFNKKNVPGLMGGGVCTNADILKHLTPQKLPVLQKIEINARLFIHYLKELNIYLNIYLQKKLFNHNNFESFDYSYGRNILYDTLPYEIPIISSARALLEIKRLYRYECIRKSNYSIINDHISNILQTANANNTPFIPIDIEAFNEANFDFLSIKNPYSVHNDPLKTLRRLYCIHNIFPLSILIRDNA